MTDEMIRNNIEKKILTLPIVQYAWLDTDALIFSDRVRSICKEECPRYGTSWSCPPGVGTVEECREKCEQYDGVFVFTTIAEVLDIENMQELMETRDGHEEVTKQIQEIFGECELKTLALSGESCALCSECSYPDSECRFPDTMVPCIEGYGIVVPLLAEKADIVFDNGGNIVTWFSAILYRESV